MLSYKEFEVLKTILTKDLAPDAESIFEQIYFELFDGKEEFEKKFNKQIN